VDKRDFTAILISIFMIVIVLLIGAYVIISMTPSEGWIEMQNKAIEKCNCCLKDNNYTIGGYGDSQNLTPFIRKICDTCLWSDKIATQ
jgi:hypothetical protein